MSEPGQGTEVSYTHFSPSHSQQSTFSRKNSILGMTHFYSQNKRKKLERHFILQILKKSDLFCSFLQNTFWVLEKLMTLRKNIHRLSRLLPLQVWWRDVLRSAQWGAGCASHRDTRAVNDIMTFYFQQSMLWTWHYPLIVKSIHKHLQILRTEWQFCTVLYCTVFTWQTIITSWWPEYSPDWTLFKISVQFQRC